MLEPFLPVFHSLNYVDGKVFPILIHLLVVVMMGHSKSQGAKTRKSTL